MLVQSNRLQPPVLLPDVPTPIAVRAMGLRLDTDSAPQQLLPHILFPNACDAFVGHAVRHIEILGLISISL
jgi:hypothetical protein